MGSTTAVVSSLRSAPLTGLEVRRASGVRVGSLYAALDRLDATGHVIRSSQAPVHYALCRQVPATRARPDIAVPALLLGLVVLSTFAVVYRRPIDFEVYRRAAVALSHGSSVYASNGQHLVFTYPPFAALALRPLAWLPPTDALVWFSAASLAAAALVASICVRTEGRDSRRIPAAVIILLLFVEPTRTTMTLGQINLIVCALVVVGDQVVRRTGVVAGVIVGTAAGLKLTPALFGLVMLVRGERRRLLTTVAAFTATAVVGAAAVTDGWTYWTSLLWSTGRVGDVARYGNQSVRAMLARVPVDPSLAMVAWVIGCFLVLTCTVRFARSPVSRARPVLTLGVTGVSSCLVSPISWGHHWVWCVPLIAGLFTWPTTDRRHRQARIWAWLLLVVFLVGPNTPVAHLVFGWTPARVVIGNAYVLAGLGILTWLTAPSLLRRSDENSCDGKGSWS